MAARNSLLSGRYHDAFQRLSKLSPTDFSASVNTSIIVNQSVCHFAPAVALTITRFNAALANALRYSAGELPPSERKQVLTCASDAIEVVAMDDRTAWQQKLDVISRCVSGLLLVGTWTQCWQSVFSPLNRLPIQMFCCSVFVFGIVMFRLTVGFPLT